MRMHPIYKILKMHQGMDFTAPVGTEIYATGDGTVEKVGWTGGYGKTILINHGYGYKTRYAHCSKFKCKKGQKVKRGDHIGYVGNTGQSTGPHLHYEVFKNNRQINPVNFFFNDLSPEEYDKVIEISSRPTQSL
jgi:murein DD-endopeptidase MepM/ murein hydrolase activator NlpD